MNFFYSESQNLLLKVSIETLIFFITRSMLRFLYHKSCIFALSLIITFGKTKNILTSFFLPVCLRVDLRHLVKTYFL